MERHKQSENREEAEEFETVQLHEDIKSEIELDRDDEFSGDEAGDIL